MIRVTIGFRVQDLGSWVDMWFTAWGVFKAGFGSEGLH